MRESMRFEVVKVCECGRGIWREIRVNGEDERVLS